MARMGFSSAGGIKKLSQLVIDAAKDWDGKDITGVASLTATALHGTTYWGDVYLEDTKCPVCDKKFKLGDKLIFIVNKVEEKFITVIPVHLVCDGG